MNEYAEKKVLELVERISLFSASLAENVKEKLLVTDRSIINTMFQIRRNSKYRVVVVNGEDERAKIKINEYFGGTDMIAVLNIRGSKITIK